jgi:hypothetical protein
LFGEVPRDLQASTGAQPDVLEVALPGTGTCGAQRPSIVPMIAEEPAWRQ